MDGTVLVKYFLAIVFGTITFAFMLVLGKIAYLAVTDDPYWVFVGLGVLMPTVVLSLITSAAYSAARDY
jgi:hypothetical protein